MIPGALEPRPSFRVLEPDVPDQALVAVSGAASIGGSRETPLQSGAEAFSDEGHRPRGLLDPLRLWLLHLIEFFIRLLRTPATR